MVFLKGHILKCVYVIVILLCFPNISASSQNRELFDGYHFNKTVINPARAGSGASSHLGMLFYRNGFNIFDDPPYTFSGFADFSLPKNIGLGVSYNKSIIGPEELTTKFGDLAYHLDLSSTWTISAGFRLQRTNVYVPLTELEIYDPADPAFANDISETVFYWGAGLLFSTERSFIGLSAPIAGYNYSEDHTGLFEKPSQIFVYLGTNLLTHQNWQLAPSGLMHFNQQSLMKFDINTSLTYKGFVRFGPTLTYYPKASSDRFGLFGFIVDLELFEKFKIGYFHSQNIRSSSMSHIVCNQMAILMYRW